ncbi:hypothetical protein ABZ915_01340 [Streptomyces sp. NPDC046915]|uniref:hypothetical protein n=1 Tax=Streptomyces sp. NPDC046915 TaxID=3155257 RepID=UPI0033ECA6D4
MWIGYALAADHGDTVESLALLDATIPGRKRSVDELLVSGREHIYYGDQFRLKAARPLPDSADKANASVPSSTPPCRRRQPPRGRLPLLSMTGGSCGIRP